MNEVFFPPKEKFINPYTDTGFKMIFGSEINKDIIIKFLNSLLDEAITDITFRNVEVLGLNRNDRKAVFDIFCKTDKEEMIIVEMQKSSQKYFSDRVLYYASFAIQQQASYAKEQLEQELKEQTALRQEYLEAIRGNLRGQLNNISIQEKDGSITDLGEKYGRKKGN